MVVYCNLTKEVRNGNKFIRTISSPQVQSL